MKRHPLASQRSLSRLFQEAAEFWRLQEYGKTIEVLERAASLDPANPQLQLDLGRAYGLRYDYPQADRCFEKAVRLTPGRSKALTEAGRRSQEFGNYAMAQRYFERAAAVGAPPAEALIALAELNERQARLDEATELVERALRIDADNPVPRLVRSRLDRLAGRLTEAEGRLRLLLEARPSDIWVRARVYYELGEVLDRSARYDEAMAAFVEAKNLVRSAAAGHLATLGRIQQRVREMEQTVTTDVFSRWADDATSLLPLRRFAILCGHPRSGTTLLEQMLDSHPDVCSAEETQILHDEAYLPLSRGFSSEATVLQVLETASAARLRQSRDDYFRYTELYLGKPIAGKLLVDKNPALNVLIPAAARIFPEAKFLIALRDPRDVCLSCFMQPLAPNPVSSAYLTLEDTVTQYLSVMSFWRALLPRLRNPCLEVRYEDLVAAPGEIARKVLQFLEIPWDESVLRFDQHARTKSLRSPSYAEVSKPINRRAVGRWQNYRRHLEPWLSRLEPILRELRYD